MKPINTSNSTFSNFREGGFLYVDKTAQIHRWVSPFQGQYFLSRPRRFGKSLLISTFKAIFEGKRELFKGLAIDNMDYDWKVYPVIHLNMGSCAGPNLAHTQQAIRYTLDEQAKVHGIKLHAEM